jgi:hypothetical protein
MDQISDAFKPLTGACSCGGLSYTIKASPMATHCCYCNECQRDTGSAFALNLVVEGTNIFITNGERIAIKVPSHSGGGKLVTRCAKCYGAVWTHYGGSGQMLAFVRLGTLDEESKKSLPNPDIHIFTEKKLPWVVLPEGCKSSSQYYKWREVWKEESLGRLDAIWPKMEAWFAEGNKIWDGQVEAMGEEELKKVPIGSANGEAQ